MRSYHDRYWAGPATAAADPWQGVDIHEKSHAPRTAMLRRARLRWRRSPRAGGGQRERHHFWARRNAVLRSMLKPHKPGLRVIISRRSCSLIQHAAPFRVIRPSPSPGTAAPSPGPASVISARTSLTPACSLAARCSGDSVIVVLALGRSPGVLLPVALPCVFLARLSKA